MNASNGPGDAGESVGVTTVDAVGVVEVDGDLIGFSGRGSPFENFFGPVHTHVAMHFAGGEHLCLGGIPSGVMGESLL